MVRLWLLLFIFFLITSLQEVAFGKVELGLELSNRSVGGSALERSSVIKLRVCFSLRPCSQNEGWRRLLPCLHLWKWRVLLEIEMSREWELRHICLHLRAQAGFWEVLMLTPVPSLDRRTGHVQKPNLLLEAAWAESRWCPAYVATWSAKERYTILKKDFTEGENQLGKASRVVQLV